ARDYWDRPGLRGWLSGRVLRAILIDRQREQPDADPLAPVRAALDQGDSLILFPEGTRSNERLPQAFKAGLHTLAVEFPHVELVPVYLDTLHRSLPKGALLPLPLPLYCNVNFGAPLARVPDESRADFLDRARAAVEAVARPRRRGRPVGAARPSPGGWGPRPAGGGGRAGARPAVAPRCASSTRACAPGGAWCRCWPRASRSGLAPPWWCSP